MFVAVIEQLVEQIQARFADLEGQMSDPAVIGDRERYAAVGREYRDLQPARELALEYSTLKDDLEGARELLEEVVSKADGALKARAQTMLDALG